MEEEFWALWFHVKNMADDELRRGQPIGCPLFTKLPTEIRLRIYDAVFEGSRASYKRRIVMGYPGRPYHNILLPTDHCNFLLTCRKAYNEALQSYWSNTILCGDHEGTEIVFFLQSVVPAFAKLHVRHIRGLWPGNLEEHPVRGCLDEFKSLQTIGFGYRRIFNMEGLDNPPTIQEQIEEEMKDAQLRFNSLIYDGGPAVISRVFFIRGVVGVHLFVEGEFKKDRKVRVSVIFNVLTIPGQWTISRLLTLCFLTALLLQQQHRKDLLRR